MIKFEIDGKEVEVAPDKIKLPEGYGLITPDSVPNGYFNQEAVNKIVKENVNKTEGRVKEKLEADTDYHKSILSKYSVQLGEDGKPVGLKPTVDVEEVKRNVTKEISSQYEDKLKALNTELETRNKAVINSSILSAVNGQFKEDWTKSFDGAEPLVVKQFAEKFTVDESGRAVLKDPENGGVKYKGDGKPYTPQDYLLDESRFGDLFADKRQRSTGTNAGGGAGKRFTEEDVAKMSDAEYAKNRDSILESLK
jgi:hypothetical protein